MKRLLVLVVSLASIALLATSCGSSVTPVSEAAPVSEDETQDATLDDSPSETPTEDATPDESVAELAGVAVVPVGDVNHVNEAVDYVTDPPAGGDHNPGWQNCGFYSVVVPKEQAVHSLEHGAVWVTYGSSVPQAELDQLAVLADAGTHLLVSAYENIDSPLVLTAWGRQASIDSIEDPLFEEFLDTYMVTGPTTPEPGAPCGGAYGVPPTDTTSISG